MLSCSSVKAVGFLDEKYFMYFEDAEFSLRMIAGFHLLYVPQSGSITKYIIVTTSFCPMYYTVRNRLL